MKKILFITFAIITFNINSEAQTTNKKEAIKELLVVMHQDSLMNKTMHEMFMAMSGSYGKIGLKDTSVSSGIETMRKKQMDATKIMVTRMVNEDMVDIYDKHFTLQEIEDFSSFYKSKSGQQWLNKSPEITKDLMMTMTSKYLPDLMKSMKETGKTN